MRTFMQAVIAFCLLISCKDDPRVQIVEEFEEDPIDQELKAAISKLSETGDIDYYILPESDDFANIPNQLRLLKMI